MFAGSFTIGEVRKITGATMRQLDYWDAIGFLKPSGGESRRKGWRSYSFEDLVRARAAVRLREEGISLEMIQRIVEKLMEHSGDPLRELKLVTYGRHVYVCRSKDEAFRAIDGQATYLFLDLEQIEQETKELVGK